MNGRKLFREYAQYKGKEATEFVEIIQQFYEQDDLITKDSKRNIEKITIDYREMVHWIIKTKNFK